MVFSNMFTNMLLLAADEAPKADPGAGTGDGMMQMMLFFVLIFGAMWFFVMRPQQRRQKEHVSMMEGLKKSDKVVTAGGFIGTIVSVDRDKRIVTLKLNDSTQVQIQLDAIRGPLREDSDSQADK